MKEKLQLADFLEQRKAPKVVFVDLNKSETVVCPDCRQNIFTNGMYAGCVCYVSEGKVFLKKTENSVQLRFGKGWSAESVEFLLETLKKK